MYSIGNPDELFKAPNTMSCFIWSSLISLDLENLSTVGGGEGQQDL